MNLALSVIAWYLTSIICTTTTREINFVTKITLTMNQFIVASICSYAICGFKPKQLPKRQKPKMWILALSFLMGMFTLNLAIGVMHVSLAMTMRAMEPLFTLALAFAISQGSTLNISAFVSLILIVIGAGLSSISSVDYTTMGLFLVGVSNFSFATRAIVYKDVKAASGLNSFEMFYHISKYVIVLGGALWILFFEGGIVTDPLKLLLLLVNGVCFFAYLQLSVIVLAKVSAITHGVMNTMRRPVTIAASTIWFGRDLSYSNKIGMFLACLGSIMYSLSQMMMKKRQVR